ncbi:MAG: hypothetical protein JO097_16655 [Acidobacteriaceae bacterium]|nr:hypothetical protein [Acidobacteriaceae bacterium]MBV9294562.1 hypothetical protein [Acidobacteriaceae bacterium]MBV9766858.1 hypothetical protein [Acidobacteriaceae bacterium]
MFRVDRRCGLFLIPILSWPALCDPESSLAIIDAGVQQSEDAPFVSTAYQFLPGDNLYFTFQVAGFKVKSEQRDEVRKIALTYQVTPEDSNGVPLCPTVSDKIQAELNPEDKDWLPKRRASFLIPAFVAAGEFHIHVVVRDLVANEETSRDFPFRTGGLRIEPSSSIAVQNFHFFRNENDQQPLDVPAYSRGDTIYARFEMTGYKLGPQNEYDLAYGLTVLRPDGKPFVQEPKAAELKDNSFYPAQFVPGTIDLTTSSDVARGEYIIVLTVRDLIGNKTFETKHAFSIE